MTTITQSTLVEANPTVVPVRKTAAPKLEVVPGKGPRRRAQKWFIGLMVASVCLFTIALATYMLSPAIATTSSTSTWNQDGP